MRIIVHRLITHNNSRNSLIRRFFHKKCQDEDDCNYWNDWEFGSFTTRKRKSSEQEMVNKRINVQNSRSMKLSSRNIDDEWCNLSDEEVDMGVNVLKDAVTESRLRKLESVLDKRTTNVRFVFVSLI